MAKKSDIRFRPAVELSVIHAAFVVGTGSHCSDVKTESALMAPTSEINSRLVSAMVDVKTFWSALFAGVASGQSARNACSPALLAAGCSELQVDQNAAGLASCLDECRIAFQQRFPKLQEQLALRAGPLKDRWQTYGPGMLIQIAREIWSSSPPEAWWPETIDCLLVQPLRGGDGGFDSGQSRVWVEAMLTDVDPQVSEIYRLAFWATQVAVGRHLDATLGRTQTPSHPEDFGSGTHRRTSLPWRLGCVPIVLQAAANLELIPEADLPIEKAVTTWRLGDPATSRVLARWWQEWGKSESPMPVALKALEKLLLPLQNSPDAVDMLEGGGMDNSKSN